MTGDDEVLRGVPPTLLGRGTNGTLGTKGRGTNVGDTPDDMLIAKEDEEEEEEEEERPTITPI